MSASAVQSPSPQNLLTPERFYRPELDVLRFFAFLAVFVHHSLPDDIGFYQHFRIFSRAAGLEASVAASGAFGVDLFFALSAYLITELLLREKDRFGHLDVRAFWIRRILRIWPLYFFAIAVAAVVPRWIPGQSFNHQYVIAFLLLSGNWISSWVGFPASVARPLWSVSIEEQFYLLWPLAVSRLSRKAIQRLAFGLLAVAVLTRLYFGHEHAREVTTYCNTLARLDPIALGILAAVWLRGRVPRLTSLGRAGLVACGGVLWLGAAYYCGMRDLTPATWAISLRYPMVAAGSILFLISMLGMSLPWPRMLVYLGRISYGLYVYHLLGLVLVKNYIVQRTHTIPEYLTYIAVALALTVTLSAASYRFLESPFLKLKSRFTYILSRPGG